MKKLYQITFLFLITPQAKADMDYVCNVHFNDDFEFIEKNCERNNILHLDSIPRGYLTESIAFWCRQDREINYLFTHEWLEEKRYSLSCVLFDNKPRKALINPID